MVTKNRTNVTIVVPVYGNWDIVRECLGSVLEFGNLDHNKLLVVSNGGPEGDVIDKNVTEFLYSIPNATYVRNPENIGFLGSCNRAVTELDTSDNDIFLLNSDAELTPGALEELQEVLHANPSHGVVCPRSNDATLATIPIFTRTRHGSRSREKAYQVWSAVKDQLPRWYVSPVSHGFALLIRRNVIRQFGLFDTVYGQGYNEENDFCLRINEAGFESLVANRALVYHINTVSFGAEMKAKLDAANRKILDKRYPYYGDANRQFTLNGYSTTDRFADLITNLEIPRKKILIFSSSAEDILNWLSDFSSNQLVEDFEISFMISKDSEKTSLQAAFPHQDVFLPGEVDTVFEFAVILSEPTTFLEIFDFYRWAYNWIVLPDLAQNALLWSHQSESDGAVQLWRQSVKFAMSAQTANPEVLLKWITKFDRWDEVSRLAQARELAIGGTVEVLDELNIKFIELENLISNIQNSRSFRLASKFALMHRSVRSLVKMSNPR